MQAKDTGFVRSLSQRVFTILLVITASALIFFMAARNDTGSETLADTVTVRGRVTDYTGAHMEGALVTFSSPGDTASATTDRNGEYIVVLNRVPTGVGYGDEKRPAGFALHQNFPNPFNPTTTIQFELDQPSQIRLDIYNITGQRVRCLMSGDVPEGLHTVAWDGVDESGNQVGAGVYLCRMTDGAHARTIRMTLVDGGGLSGGVRPVMKPVSGVSHSDQATEYTIAVMKEGYKDYTETEFLVSFEEGDIEKNMVLAGILPIADAGPDQTIPVGRFFTLDGSGSSPGGGKSLRYFWKELTNPVRLYLDYRAMQPVEGLVEKGEYRFSLIVENEYGTSEPDTVVITAVERENVLFEDPGLELSVRLHLNKPTGEITEAEVAVIDSLVDQVWTGELTSLRGIEKMPNLYWLCLGINSLTDISPLASLRNLRTLMLDQNFVLEDISPLAALSNLTYLNIESNNISDISSLEGLTNLVYLQANYNPIQDITPLSGLTNLQVIYLSHTTLKTGLEGLSNLNDLRLLWLSSCGITDISPLINLANLKTLYLCYNNITDISSLEFLPKLSSLDLSKNNITDISPLVRNADFSDGVWVRLNGNPLNDVSINEHIPALKARNVTVTF